MKRRYTRAELVEKLNEHGYPISKAKMDKMCAPSIGQGPPVNSWWGPRPLYDLDEAIAWAEALLKAHRSALQTPAGAMRNELQRAEQPAIRRT
jgi:hypothetical protein